MGRKKAYQKKPFKPIDRESFRELRLMSKLTINQTAKFLQVTSRTVSHWENGNTRIPYTAFKLLRCLANGAVFEPAWHGWSIKGDTLWSPIGRPFRVYELTYLSHYITMARYWVESLERKQNEVKAPVLPFELKIIKGGRS